MNWWKTSQEGVQVMKVIRVGSSPESHNEWLNLTVAWLHHNDQSMFDAQWQFEFMDINDGRDYLAESVTGDVVLVEFLYAPDEYDDMDELTSITGIRKTSPLNSPEAWRSKLSSSGAKYIFTFGGSGEISGEWIGDVPGYKKVEHNSVMTVYRRAS